jgi:hypothetical protein
MAKAAKSNSTMSRAERAVGVRSNKLLGITTKRYRRFMRQARKATTSAKKGQYLAAALSALVIAGAVAAQIKAGMNKKTRAASARKKRR